MTHGRSEGRKSDCRAFRPTVDGTLESRQLMTTLPAVLTHVAAGGQAQVVTNTDGMQFFVSVIGGGTIKAFPASGGRVSLVVNGSTEDTALEINQILPNLPKNGAHTFNSDRSTQGNPLNIAGITITSGKIGDIEGYRDSVLSGPIVASATTPVQRIAFESIVAGGSIRVGGSLNTLDVLDNADFTGSAGLFVGQDLNSFSVGGNLSVRNGSTLYVTRDIGLFAQAAVGSGPGGQGMSVGGNVSVDSTSGIGVGRYLEGSLVIQGNLTGAGRIIISGFAFSRYQIAVFQLGLNANTFVRGTVTQ